MPINYIICSAGRGSRFEKDFPGIPKPAIKLKGRYLLDWSLDSLPIKPEDKVIVITQEQHKVKERLCNSTRSLQDDITWIELDYLTGGQLETALTAKSVLDMDSSIAIFNCDTYYQGTKLEELAADESVEGIIPCLQVPGESWSFCKIDDNDRVTAVAEKKRISDWASVGLYYFRDTKRFVKMAEEYIAANKEGETYVAPFYQSYLDAGYKIMIDRVTEFKPMGTPDQIEDYWKIPIADVIKENN